MKCEYLAGLTGLEVTCKLVKKVHYFEFKRGNFVTHSCFTYPKAKQYALGYNDGIKSLLTSLLK